MAISASRRRSSPERRAGGKGGTAEGDRFVGVEAIQGSSYADRITDFSHAQGDGIVTGDANAMVEGFQAFRFIGTGEFTDVGQLRWYHPGGETVVEGNLDAAPGAELRIVLDHSLSLQASDFIVAATGFAPPIQEWAGQMSRDVGNTRARQATSR